MVPTVLDALGLEPPAAIRGVTQSPIHGVSFAHTFDDRPRRPGTTPSTSRCSGTAPSTMTGGGRCARGPGPSFAEAGKPFGAPITAETLTDLDAHHWELYHVAEDPAENHNLADQHRDKLIELIAMWYTEAGKYNVFPLDGSAAQRLMTERPQVAEPRDRVRIPARHPDDAVLGRPAGAATGRTPSPPTRRSPMAAPRACCCARAATPAAGRSTSRTAGCVTPTTTSAGRPTRCRAGPASGGQASAAVRVRAHRQAGPHPGQGLPGRAQLYVDGQLIAQDEFPVTTPIAFNPGGLTCGANPGSAVTADYQAPFPFTGTLHTVTVDLSGDLITDTDSEMRMAMARQ